MISATSVSQACRRGRLGSSGAGCNDSAALAGQRTRLVRVRREQQLGRLVEEVERDHLRLGRAELLDQARVARARLQDLGMQASRLLVDADDHDAIRRGRSRAADPKPRVDGEPFDVVERLHRVHLEVHEQERDHDRGRDERRHQWHVAIEAKARALRRRRVGRHARPITARRGACEPATTRPPASCRTRRTSGTAADTAPPSVPPGRPTSANTHAVVLLGAVMASNGPVIVACPTHAFLEVRRDALAAVGQPRPAHCRR